MVKNILVLGNPDLYETSEPVLENELHLVADIVNDLHDTLMDFREKHGTGRAIAAPQIGVRKRIIYMNITEPVVFINPDIWYVGIEDMELLDDCFSFPGLLVKVRRTKQCIITYKDMNWKDCKVELDGDLSELLQHEYDHLDGVLATMRAVDRKSFFIRNT